MTHIIKGFMIIAVTIGSIYGLSKFISNFFHLETDDWEDKMEIFMATILGLLILVIIGISCYLIGGGGQ